jgi:hypothetical protein
LSLSRMGCYKGGSREPCYVYILSLASGWGADHGQGAWADANEYLGEETREEEVAGRGV